MRGATWLIIAAAACTRSGADIQPPHIPMQIVVTNNRVQIYIETAFGPASIWRAGNVFAMFPPMP